MENNPYGLTPMSFQEELNAPEAVRETRAFKVEIIDNCDRLIRLAERIRDRVKRIPEENDEAHVELVNKYAEGVHRAVITLLENECLREGGI